MALESKIEIEIDDVLALENKITEEFDNKTKASGE